MKTTGYFSLTPEQITALDAGHGVMHGQDPATQRRYMLIEQIEPTISDDYLRARITEGLVDIEAGNVSDWNADAFKQQLLKRHQ